jgi:hypothetical protein
MAFDCFFGGQSGGSFEARKFMRRSLSLIMSEGVAPGSRVEFDYWCADRARSFNRFDRWLDKERNANAGAAEFTRHYAQMLLGGDHIEAAFGGSLAALFRHEAAGVRARIESNRDHLVRRRHFEIERLRDFLLQPFHIVVADMAAVLAQMRSYAIGASRNREQSRAQGIRHAAAARIAKRRDMIDVYTQPQRQSHQPFTLSTLLITGFPRNCEMML